MTSSVPSFHKMSELLHELPDMEMGSKAKACCFQIPEDFCLYVTKIWQRNHSWDHTLSKVLAVSLAFPSLPFFTSKASSPCPSPEKVARMQKPLCSEKHQLMSRHRGSAKYFHRLATYKMWFLVIMLWHQTWTMDLAHKLFTSSFLEALKDLKVAVCLY